MAEKQLIVVVEGTAAMGAFWKSIVSDYLDKMIRNFCNNELTQNASIPNFELALVVFGTHGPCSTFLVRRTGWTRNIDIFFQWLSSIPFSGGGFSDAAITEGLSEALMMFPLSNTGSEAQKNADLDKHCILVTASNPYPLATPLYRPTVQIGEQTKNGDAEDVARSFSQCSISLSVISPKQLPKLRAIFNAGKCLNGMADMPLAENQKYPNFLLLISEKFIESCSPLSKPVITSTPVKVEAACVSTVSGPCPSPPAAPPVNAAASPMEAGNHTSPPPLSPYSHVPAAPRVPLSSGMANGHASSSPVSQEVTSIAETAQQEMKPPPPVIGVVPPRPAPSATANMNILNSISQARLQSITGATSAPMAAAMHMPPPASGVPSSVLQPGPAAPMMNVPNDGTAPMDASGMPQRVQLPGQQQSMVGRACSPQPAPPASAAQPTKYVKVWEGHLSGQRQRQSVFITRLEGYRCASASETLASNWPPAMQIVRLIAQNYMSENSDVRQYLGKADYLVFRALNQHNFLAQLQEKKLCAVIQLPSQTLLLSVSDKAFRLIGMLFPGDMVVFKPTSHPSQQQQVQQSMQQVKQQMSSAPQMVQQQQQSMQSLAYLGHASVGRPQLPSSQVTTQTSSSSAMNGAAFLPQ